jgi:hypothetical protein
MTAEAIDRAADIARTKAADEKGDGKAGHGEGSRPAVIGRDQGYGENRRIEQRAPG